MIRLPALPRTIAFVLVAASLSAPGAAVAGTEWPVPRATADLGAAAAAVSGWVWPVAPPTIARAFVAPAHEYGPGHRGLDLVAPRGAPVVSPAPGVVAFAGTVAGRGIVTIDHRDGLVTTLEPVHAGVAIGTVVRAGDTVAVADAGGHAAAGTVHFGVRDDGAYINPALMFGAVERAVLLPCC